jgi:hypothetical protein
MTWENVEAVRSIALIFQMMPHYSRVRIKSCGKEELVQL